MIDYIFLNQDKIIAMLMLVAFSLLTRASVGVHNQNWIKTFSGTMTLILLPIITFAITSVIAGNIALSLGMIGALSIVRFRNPVRSSFELVIFFLMLSLGICAASDIRWLIILGIASNALIISAYFINLMMKDYLNKELFAASFSEGNTTNTLEITSKEQNDDLFNSPLLVSFNKIDEEFIYRLASSDTTQLKKISAQYQSNNDIVNIRFSAS
tara:strand:- start:133 stop:771 length:639 start_codon:yes stop_codon:yes gene_type:complete